MDLGSLCGPGISTTVADLGKYTASAVVTVTAHIGRNHATVPMPAKQLGMKAEALSEMLNEYNTEVFWNSGKEVLVWL